MQNHSAHPPKHLGLTLLIPERAPGKKKSQPAIPSGASQSHYVAGDGFPDRPVSGHEIVRSGIGYIASCY